MRRAALVIAVLALLGAWGGPAVADRLLTGGDVQDRSLTGLDVRNRSLTGRDVRHRSLHGRHLRSNTVTGRVVAGLSGRDLLPDSLDGSDIAEETLDVRRARTAERADSAATADALRDARVARLHARLSPGQSTTLLELGGLTLRATCTASAALVVRAATATGPAFVRATGIHRSGGSNATAFAKDDDFQPGEEFDALAGAGDSFNGQLVYSAPDAHVVTATFLAEEALPGAGCIVAGTATHAAG